MEFSRAGRKMLNVVDGYAMVTRSFRKKEAASRKEGRKEVNGERNETGNIANR